MPTDSAQALTDRRAGLIDVTNEEGRDNFVFVPLFCVSVIRYIESEKFIQAVLGLPLLSV